MGFKARRGAAFVGKLNAATSYLEIVAMDGSTAAAWQGLGPGTELNRARKKHEVTFSNNRAGFLDRTRAALPQLKMNE